MNTTWVGWQARGKKEQSCWDKRVFHLCMLDKWMINEDPGWPWPSHWAPSSGWSLHRSPALRLFTQVHRSHNFPKLLHCGTSCFLRLDLEFYRIPNKMEVIELRLINSQLQLKRKMLIMKGKTAQRSQGMKSITRSGRILLIHSILLT